MSYESLPGLSRKRDKALQATSFTTLPADPLQIPRSYSEIRRQMHLSLQARLNREYVIRKPVTLNKSEVTVKESRKMWVAVRKAAMTNALSQIKIEAKLKTLASRMKAEVTAKLVPIPISHINLPDVPKITRLGGLPAAPPISVKEAMKDREWFAKNREGIQRAISTLLNDSNGIRVTPPESSEPYKYYIKKGNNSKLLRQIMKNRGGWVKVKVKSEANFVWSHMREMAFFALIPSAKLKSAPRIDDTKVSLICPAKCCLQGAKIPRIVSLKPLGFSSIIASPSYARVLSDSPVLNPLDIRVHNRLENNTQLTHKKALFYNMKRYYEAIGEDYTQYLPLTFHVSKGENDPEFLSFLENFTSLSMLKSEELAENARNLWIVKPGENSNQGRDIAVCTTIQQVRAELRSSLDFKTGQKRTFIIQKYIERPFLYCKRKFDIRCYAMITGINGVIQGYYYPEGYLRTSSREFSLKHVNDKFTHLTNDAVQKTCEDYGKFEHGNKVSYTDFQRYLDLTCPELQANFLSAILPLIKRLIQDSIKATFLRLDPKRRCHSFEILGYDFMLDWNLRPVLIEVNTNPCLSLVSPVLYKVIPPMLEGGLRLVLDGLFPEHTGGKKSTEPIAENRWELIFHELVDGKALRKQLQWLGTSSLLESQEAYLDCTGEEDEYDQVDISTVG